MFPINKLVVLVTLIVALSSFASAFFWGSSETPAPPMQFYYQKRLLQGGPSPYSGENNDAVPAIPIQMPLQAQFAPAPNVHNVQLVPCLCPVSQELDYEKSAGPETVYVNANVQHKAAPPNP